MDANATSEAQIPERQIPERQIPERQFPEGLFQEWLSERFADSPTVASSLGLTDYDSELGDFSEQAFDRRSRSTRRWASRLGQGDGQGVGEDAAVDAALLASELAGEGVMDGWQSWRRDPEIYLGPCLSGVFNLFLHRLRPEPELVAAAISRLRQVPGILEHARSQLDPGLASRTVLERGVGTAGGGAQFFRDTLVGEVTADDLRAKIAGPAEEASMALNRFAQHLSDMAGEAKGSWAIGEERYSALLGRRELLDVDASELSTVGERAWGELDVEMTELARRIDPAAPTWRAVTAALSADHPSSPEQLVEAYQAACERARAFLIDRELVTLPEGEHCSVEPSPEFLRPVIAVASYEQPPPFAPGHRGHFFVPFPPAGASAENIDQLLADNSWSSIPTIAVHEAYPGHHWQLAWSKRANRPLRQVITTPYFIEGWALYAESMMRGQGFFATPEQELAHLESRIFRAARVVVDTSLHCGRMSFAEAVDYMMSHTSLTPTVARAEVSRYCAWPTQAASYLVGALELDRLYERWRGENRGNLRQFHDKVAESPGLPLPLAGRVLFAGGGSLPRECSDPGGQPPKQ